MSTLGRSSSCVRCCSSTCMELARCEYSGTLKLLGFTVGEASACTFWHADKRLRCSVYGDDFTTAGPKCNLDWFKKELERHYELIEGARLGPGPEDDKEGRVLNRVVRWTADGITYEADPRQSEKLVKELGLEGSKALSTPGLKATAQEHLDDSELGIAQSSPFRAVAARANYLAADRPEIQFASKQACRWMAKPTELGKAASRG